MKTFITITFFLIFFISKSQNAELHGKLTDKSGNPVEYATIGIKNFAKGTESDENGLFKLKNIPSNTSIEVVVRHISFETKIIKLIFNENEIKKIDIELSKSNTQLKEIEVNVTNYEDKREQVSIIKINPRETKFSPSVTGDFNKVLATLPGVSSNNELSSTYSVRGGNFDENLVYVNDMIVYRPFLVSAGQQEGLSFVNPDLVEDVEFSSGGWQPRYGDKLSSVLAIQYKKPTKFGGSITAGMLGGSLHLEGGSKDKRVSAIIGIRYKDTRRALSRLQTKAEYRPWFLDIQSFINFDLTNRKKHSNQINKTTLGILTSIARNSYLVIPESKETTFGTFNGAFRLFVAFEGQEKMEYDTYQNGLRLSHRFNSKWSTFSVISHLATTEREYFDIEGGYRLCDVSLDANSDNFNKCVYTRGVGTIYRYARNKLNAQVVTFQNNWKNVASEKSVFEFGFTYSKEMIEDKLAQYSFVDSSDYVFIDESVFTDLNLVSDRVGGFAQHSIQLDSASHQVFTYGFRTSYWSVNNQVTFSPRIQYSIAPNWKRDVVFKMAAGFYHQPPFYRELRNNEGVLNKDLKAQQSFHAIIGSDYNFDMWGRNFKLLTELYYKRLSDVVSYDIDDVKIRYSAQNNAEAYAYGVDMRISGEFIRGSESWFSLGILRTRENLENDYFIGRDGNEREAGYVPRPTDQLVTFGVFFQDHLPNNPSIRMYLNLLFASGLPFNPPGTLKYRYEYTDENGNKQTATTYGRMAPYRRLDLGFSKLLTFNENAKFVESIWIGVEILNVIAANNEISRTWIKDVNNTRYGIPNYLTGRLFNLKGIVKF